MHFSGECVRVFTDKGGGPSLTVIATLLPATSGGRPQYRVVLRRASGGTSSLPYSMFSLGIQGRRWRVEIKEATGIDVTFTEWGSPSTPVVVSGISQPVNQMLLAAQPKGSGKIDEDRLWFVNFTGEVCELKVASFRPKPRKSAGGIVTDHDVAPPPPEGGGDYGDEE